MALAYALMFARWCARLACRGYQWLRGVHGATLGLVWLALGQAACVSSRAFMPAEHVTALSPRGGQLAAEYSVREGSELIAEVKLWSNGATRNAGEDDDDATVVRIGFEIQNHSSHPVRLDTRQLYLEDLALDEGKVDRVSPLRVDGPAEVQPGKEAEVGVSFQLPGDVYPEDVRSYRVSWRLTNGGVYEEKTPFVFVRRQYDDPAFYYPPPYYYWGGYPSWYWGYRYRVWPGWRYRYYPYYP